MAYTLNYFWINNDTGFVVSGFTDSDPSNPTAVIDIPATHTGLNESGEIITRPVIGIIGGAEDTPYGLFKDNTNITKVNLPESMLFIYAETFMGCTNLTSITLPKFQSPDENNPSFIGADAFTNSGLTTIYYTGTVEQWNNISIDPTAIPSTVRKYLLKTTVIELPEGSELIKSTTDKDLVSTYAIKDVKGNQIDTYYMPASEKQILEEIANGKCKSYIVNTLAEIRGAISADKGTITDVQAITGISDLSALKIGDVIFVKENDVPDYWVSNITGTKDLTKLETTKVEASVIDSVGAHILDAGSTPTASISGEPSQQHLEFGIPKGDTGNGINSITGPSSNGLVDTYTINYTNGTTKTYNVTNGTSATVQVGSISMTDVGTAPTVSNSGTANDAIFNFTIPKAQTISYDPTNKILTITSV